MEQTSMSKALQDFNTAAQEVGRKLSEAMNKDFTFEVTVGDDPVHSPSHYNIPGTGVEVIDVIQGILSPEEFKGYCYGNVIKYILRAPNKGGAEDFKKAQVYLDWLLTELSDEEGEEADL